MCWGSLISLDHVWPKVLNERCSLFWGPNLARSLISQFDDGRGNKPCLSHHKRTLYIWVTCQLVFHGGRVQLLAIAEHDHIVCASHVAPKALFFGVFNIEIMHGIFFGFGECPPCTMKTISKRVSNDDL